MTLFDTQGAHHYTSGVVNDADASTSKPELPVQIDVALVRALEPGSIRLLRNGAEAYPAWLAAIASAREEILLEMYWFGSDATGRRFADALAERAKAGVDVYVLYDSVGSLGTDEAMWNRIVEAGGHVLEFHPIAPWRKRFRLDRVTLRDHRKILVVDGRVGFTGGINIGDPWAPESEGGKGWRDDAVSLTGPAVAELRALFFDNWLRMGGPPPRRGLSARRRSRRSLMNVALEQAGRPALVPKGPDNWRERLRRASAQFARDMTRPAPGSVAPPKGPHIQVLGHWAWGVRRTIRRMYLAHIRHARDKILIANSYFIPDAIVRKALERAAKRGVEVRVIVPRHSDVPSVGYASRALYAGLMRAGVHIHEWLDGMMHAKTALIDGWATVGSYNLDYRSLRYNLEVNVASTDPEFVAAVEQSFRADLLCCEEVDPVHWAHRPLLMKLLEWVHYLVRRLL